MSKKHKKKKKGLAQHSDYCTCRDCNEKEYNKVTSHKKGEKSLIKQGTTSIIPTKNFKHARSCLCVNCVNENKLGQNHTPTLDHTLNCVCYKCKKNKELGKTGKSTTTYTNSYSACHEGNVFVFKKDGVSIYGAGNLKDPEPGKVDIVIDLDRNVRVATWADDLPEHFQSRKQAKSNVIVLDLFIKDMYAPEHVTAEFWILFWKDLIEESKKLDRNLKVLVMCQGGHGRTGVVIASLIMASAYNKVGISEDTHPVAWLRKQYCNKAVESLRQTEYLTKTWGMRFVSASKANTTSFQNKDTNGSGTKVPDDEIPDANTVCYACKIKNKQDNRVLFSGDAKEFECDKCFGIRAAMDETGDENDNNDTVDQTELCEGKECNDEYNDMTGVWTTRHTYDENCKAFKDDECGGNFCGFHTNVMLDGWIHTYDEGCTAEEGEDPNNVPINNMTDKQYDSWAESLL